MDPIIMGICSDHAGYALKQHLTEWLKQQGVVTRDFGCFSNESCDYPDFAHLMAGAIERGELSRGISICGSGNGISMVINKYPHLRAALSWCVEVARLGRAHNNANVLSLPARFITQAEAEAIVESFLTTPFEGGRHECRVEKIPILTDRN